MENSHVSGKDKFPIKYSDLVTKVGASFKGIAPAEDEAQTQLLKLVILQRLGVDMSGLMFGIRQEKTDLILLYYEKNCHAFMKENNLTADQLTTTTAQELKQKSLQQVDDFVESIQKALDPLLGKRPPALPNF